MRRRELVLLAIAATLALSGRAASFSDEWVPPACEPEVWGLDPNLPCTVPLDVEVSGRQVTLRWHAAEVESILGDKFGGYKVWRWRVPRGYDSVYAFDPATVKPDTSSYTLLQTIARRDTTVQFYPFSFDSVGGEWVFRDPADLFTFTKASSLHIAPGGGRGDSVFFFTTIPREEAGPINGFPYFYAVTYFGDVVDPVFSTDSTTAYVTTDMSSKEPDAANGFQFPIFTGGRPRSNLGDVYVIPNPYSKYAAWEYLGEKKIQFVNLPDGSKVDIYTVAGDFVKTLRLDAGRRGTGAVNTLDWDLRTEAREEVAAGIYIYRVEAPNGRESIGRFVIIR